MNTKPGTTYNPAGNQKMILSNNERVHMTRRYPNLPKKVLLRDSVISNKIIKAWDVDKDNEKVLSIFLKEKNNLSDERYWELLRTVWVLCGSVQNVDLFRKLMSSNRKERYYFSTPEDAKALREMPDTFQVYRACNEEDNGISWTTSIDYAEQFQREWSKEKIIIREVNKKEVFAFIRRNLEFEIIIL